MNSSNRGASGRSTHNSGSPEEFQRDSEQMNLLFTAIASVALIVTLFALAFGVIIESDWEIKEVVYWIIMGVLLVIVMGIFATTFYAVTKTNRLPLYQPESREIYMLCFVQLKLIFRAVSSVGSILTFFVVGLSVTNNVSWTDNKAVLCIIIIALSVSSASIIILTVQTVKKSKKHFSTKQIFRKLKF